MFVFSNEILLTKKNFVAKYSIVWEWWISCLNIGLCNSL